MRKSVSRALRRFDHEDAVRADATMPVAQAGDRRAVELDVSGPVVEHHEVVARAVHLGEGKFVHDAG